MRPCDSCPLADIRGTLPDRGRRGNLPSLLTVHAVFPHAALRSVVSSSGLAHRGMDFGKGEKSLPSEEGIEPTPVVGILNHPIPLLCHVPVQSMQIERCLPMVPSPTTWCRMAIVWFRHLNVTIGFRASPPVRKLAATPCRIEFVIRRTDQSPPVAPHPASRRRSHPRLPGFGLLGHGLAPC
jgi:hypothetical protein